MLPAVLWRNALPYLSAPFAEPPLALIFRSNGPANLAGAALPPDLNERIHPSLPDFDLRRGDGPAIGALLGHTEGKPVG